MINLRFHLVSLVAVFLALGVGATMGASIVNRATVDTLRDRVDAVEANYKERGEEIDNLSQQLAAVDASSERLVDQRSAILPGQLTGHSVVEVVSADLPAESFNLANQVVATAGATRSGRITLEPALNFADSEDAQLARDRLGIKGSTATALRSAALRKLAGALSVLSVPLSELDVPAPPPSSSTTESATPAAPAITTPTPSTTSTTTPVITRPGGPRPDLGAVAAARTIVRDFADLGLITIDAAGSKGGEAVPDVAGVTYVMLVSPESSVADNAAVRTLAAEVSELAPASVTVGELAAPRPGGASPTSSKVPDAASLGNLRSNDEIAARLSTVDDLEEPFGRLALVLALQQEGIGIVGHYGNGPGATAPFPEAVG